MLRTLKWLRSPSVSMRYFMRHKSVVIRQVETSKLSRADQIKKQNFETSHLFGPKVRKKNVTKKVEDTSNGKNSEMYWILSEKSQKKKLDKKDDHEELPVKASKKKKTSPSKEEKLSDTFAKFKLDLPKPVKVTIQNALDNLDITNDADSRTSKETPFDQQQLRKIIDFPLILHDNDLMLDMFDKTLIMKRQISFTPSVSKVLQATMSASQRNALVQWKNLKIAELGVEGFEQMQKEYLNRGRLFHECVQRYFQDETDIDVPSNVKELWKSIASVLDEFQTPAISTEFAIFHPHLRYKGVIDCVSLHQKSGALSVIEWKNSDRHKKSVSNTFDAPLQLCAYLGALNATEFKNNPIKSGVIAVAYNDGQSADLFHLSSNELEKYWKLWLNRLQDYWIRYRDNTLSDEEI